jgi:hypothetical protein
MAGQHHQNPLEVADGEVYVNTEDHEVVRHNNRDSQEVIGRTRTTATRHDGTQRKRN